MRVWRRESRVHCEYRDEKGIDKGNDKDNDEHGAGIAVVIGRNGDENDDDSDQFSAGAHSACSRNDCGEQGHEHSNHSDNDDGDGNGENCHYSMGGMDVDSGFRRREVQGQT